MQGSLSIHAAVAAAALFAAGAACAQSSATSTIGLSFSLVDLDPTDGIAPSMTFDPDSRSTAIWGTDGAGGSTSSTQQGASAFGAVTSSGTLGGAGGSASFSGDILGSGTQVSASAMTATLSANGSGTAFVAGPPSEEPWFMLSPHTQVYLEGATTITWDAGSAAGAAYGEVDLALNALGSDDFSMGYAVAGYYGTGDGDVSGSKPGGVTVTFTNDSDLPEAVGYQVGVYANASEFEVVLPPVDEPSNAVLLLAGASALWWGLRRRR